MASVPLPEPLGPSTAMTGTSDIAALQQTRAAVPSRGQHCLQFVETTVTQQRNDFGQGRLKAVEFPQQRAAVRGENLPPQRGIRARDPCEIAQPRAGKVGGGGTARTRSPF